MRRSTVSPRRRVERERHRRLRHGRELRRVGRDDDHLSRSGELAHELCDEHEDVATASLLENFIDEAEKRCWFLFEASRNAERTGH